MVRTVNIHVAKTVSLKLDEFVESWQDIVLVRNDNYWYFFSCCVMQGFVWHHVVYHWIHRIRLFGLIDNMNSTNWNFKIFILNVDCKPGWYGVGRGLCQGRCPLHCREKHGLICHKSNGECYGLIIILSLHMKQSSVKLAKVRLLSISSWYKE